MTHTVSPSDSATRSQSHLHSPHANSPEEESSHRGLHVAIIMDGNGRWAEARGMPRTAGHVAGVKAVRRVVEAAPAQGIGMLTLYAFSSDNWKRPGVEVQALMLLLERFLRSEVAECARKGVRIEVVGRRDRLPLRVLAAIVSAERATAAGTVLRLRLAIDYSSRDEIVRASSHAPRSREALALRLEPVPGELVRDVDLVIRTGGEQRLSDFLLWESAYAELYFTELAWPEFERTALAAAVAEFNRRTRRFGAVTTAPSEGARVAPDSRPTFHVERPTFDQDREEYAATPRAALGRG